jgi:methionyl aminopeptidase
VSYPLQPGMTYAIEPMVTAGRPETRELSDKWTVVTRDGSLCAHFEHTIAITDGEPLILTLP